MVHLPEEETDMWTLLASSLTSESKITLHKTKVHSKWKENHNYDPRCRWEGYYKFGAGALCGGAGEYVKCVL